jgi:hypothetical protein
MKNIAAHIIFNCSLRTAALRLIAQSWLDMQISATRRLHVCHHARAPSGRRWNCGQEMFGNFAKLSISMLHLGIFYMPWSYDMGPTALLPLRRKAYWGFFRSKNPDVNPRTWVPKASTLPLDHRSRYARHITVKWTPSAAHTREGDKSRERCWEGNGRLYVWHLIHCYKKIMYKKWWTLSTVFSTWRTRSHAPYRQYESVRLAVQSKDRWYSPHNVNTSHLRIVKISPHALHNSTFLYVAQQLICHYALHM